MSINNIKNEDSGKPQHVPMKWCNRCRMNKPLSEFHNNKNLRDGKHTQCGLCNTKITLKGQYRRRLKAIAIYGGKCQNKECPFPDINTDSNYLQFHHKYGQMGIKKKEYALKTCIRVIRDGIQEDLELYCPPCHKYADIKDGTYFNRKRR